MRTSGLSGALETWVPVVLYTGLIFALSSIPNLTAPGDVEGSDKLLHFGEYLIWGFLLRRALDRVVRAPDGVNSALAVVAGACLAYFDESFQRTVGRHFSVLDMTADFAGVVAAQIIHDIRARRAARGEQDEV